jgi:hypothetical protein
MVVRTPARTQALWVSCPAGKGIDVDVDIEHRLLWIAAKSLNLNIAISFDDLDELQYDTEDGTLCMTLQCATLYVEIPCSRRQAEHILATIGHDPSSLLCGEMQGT